MILRKETTADIDAITEVTLVHEGIPQEVFLALPFNEKVPQGTIEFHESYLATG